MTYLHSGSLQTLGAYDGENEPSLLCHYYGGQETSPLAVVNKVKGIVSIIGKRAS